MAKKKSGFEWLDTSNDQTIDWAYKYLREHGAPASTPFGDVNAAALLKKGERLESTAEGREVIREMRNAYRQGKWRTSHPELKSRTFRLQKQSAESLDSLAKKEQVTPTYLIEALITETAKAHAGISQKLKASKQRESDEKLKAKLRERGDRARIAQLETMLSDALMKLSHYEATTDIHGQLVGPLTSATQERAHDRYQKAWTQAQEKLGIIQKEHAGLHEIKRAMERS